MLPLKRFYLVFNSFYNVEPTEDATNATHTDAFQHMNESYEPMDCGASIPVVEEENELTYAHNRMHATWMIRT